MEHTEIGGYRIESKLGEGGMGVVYRAKDPTLDRLAAVKVIRPAAVTDTAKERFIREARACSRINHPNIVTVYGAGEVDGAPYLVMEFLEGRTLSDIIEEGPVPWHLAVDWMICLLDALGRLHSEGIVHRDLKPDNIHITTDGVAKLMDFGIAHTETNLTLTEEGMTLGTAHYMSPEQAAGEKVDARSDVFSMGGVFYEMLTGARAFEGEHAMAVLYSITNSPHRPLSEHDIDLPDGIGEVIDKALKKEPGDRYGSGAEFATALRPFIGTAQMPALPKQTGGLPKWTIPVVGGAVVVAVIIGALLMRGGGGPDTEAATRHNETGQELQDANDFAGAREAFRGAIEADPNYAPPWNNLGMLVLAEGDSLAADTLLTRYVGMERDATGLYNLADLKLALGDSTKARLYFGLAIDTDPDMTLAYNNLAAVLIAQRKFDEARDVLDRALALHPNTAMLYAESKPYLLKNRGMVAARSGHDEEALAYWQEAVDLDPDMAELHLLLVRWYERNGRSGEAAPHRTRYIELNRAAP